MGVIPVAIESAFRANKIGSQPVLPNVPVIVTFEQELFDFSNEYNNVQTFSPNQAGVYSIVANVAFLPAVIGQFSIQHSILVNNDIIASESLTQPSGAGQTALEVSTIYLLNAGDQVNVRFFSTTAGSIGPSGQTTHFAAARFPFTI